MKRGQLKFALPSQYTHSQSLLKKALSKEIRET